MTIPGEDGREQTLALSRNGVVQTVRYRLYHPAGVREIPTADFVNRGTATGLDFESCQKAIKRPPFALEIKAGE